MLVRVQNDGQGKWLVKKKFLFALLAFIAGFYIGVQTGAGLGEWTAFSSMVLGLIFAADITDKRLNGGSYNNEA